MADNDPQRWPFVRLAHRPENELGIVVPINLTLARLPELIITLTHAKVLTAGITMFLTCRSGSSAVDDNGHAKMIPTARPPGVLLFGVEFADGRAATNMTGGLPTIEDPEEPLLSRGPARASSGVDERTYFLTPLPPAGPLTVVLAAPLLGITDARYEIDTAPFRDAQAHAEVLWPEPTYEQRRPPSYPIPEDNWFHGRPRDGRAG